MSGLHAEEGLQWRLCILYGPVGGLLQGPLHEPVHQQRQEPSLHALRQVQLPAQDEGMQRPECWRPLRRKSSAGYVSTMLPKEAEACFMLIRSRAAKMQMHVFGYQFGIVVAY